MFLSKLRNWRGHTKLTEALLASQSSTCGVRRCYHVAQVNKSSVANHVVDMRTDCLSLPTESMKDAMRNSSTGDDVFDEDDNVHELQDKMAEMFGKEAALFVPSGTMGNLISIMSHTWEGRGLEVLLGDMCHLTMYEQGGIAAIAHVHPRTMPNNVDGTFDLDKLDGYIRPRNDPHQPYTALIAVENTHNNCGGKVLPMRFLKELREKASSNNLKVHMDGARLMNAIVKLDVEPTEILQYVDTVTMCFSKGIGTPVGSVMAGEKDFIERAVRLRKMLGGGWRKPGVLAAAALHALQDVRTRMNQDHAHAQQIAHAIMASHHDAVHVDVKGVHTNLIMVHMRKPGLTAQKFCDRLTQVTQEEEKALGERVCVKAVAFYPTVARLALYSSITSHDVELAIAKIQYVIKALSEE